MSFLQGVHHKDQVAVQSTLGKTPEEGAEQVFRVVRPDGSTRWVRSREFAVYNEQGEIYWIAGIREDITEYILKISEADILEARIPKSAARTNCTELIVLRTLLRIL